MLILNAKKERKRNKDCMGIDHKHNFVFHDRILNSFVKENTYYKIHIPPLRGEYGTSILENNINRLNNFFMKNISDVY